MLPLRWSYLSLFSAISFLCLKARSQSSNVRWWILTDISTQIRVQLLNCRCSRQNYALHQFCIFTKVSEAQFISVRFPTVGIPLMSISAEHRIPEISKLRIALIFTKVQAKFGVLFYFVIFKSPCSTGYSRRSLQRICFGLIS